MMLNHHQLFLPFVFLLFIMLFPLQAAGSGDVDSENHTDSHDENPEEMIPRIEQVILNGRKLNVVATTSFIGDVLTNIAGSTVELTILMTRGQNPHSWEPGPGSIAAIEDADLIFINGLGLEAELLSIIRGMNTAPVVPVSVGIAELRSEEQDNHHHDTGNPHVWFSPLNVIQWAVNIGTALSVADPENRAVYKEETEAYIQNLESLDSEIRRMLSVLETADRVLITDHSSFDYYARDYGFDILGNIVPSLSDQAEPSAREIAALIELVREENVKAIFVGGTAGRSLKKLASSVAEESSRELPVVELLAGSLAIAGQRGSHYPDFIRFNTELIVEALYGE